MCRTNLFLFLIICLRNPTFSLTLQYIPTVWVGGGGHTPPSDVLLPPTLIKIL